MNKSFTNNTIQKYKDLVLEFEDFKKDPISEYKANNIANNSWHLNEWIFDEYKDLITVNNIGDFRKSLFLRCEELKLVHDIANSAKHKNLTRPKATIKKASLHQGDYSPRDFCGKDFHVSKLEIIMDDDSKTNFIDTIKIILDFWSNYLLTDLKENIN